MVNRLKTTNENYDSVKNCQTDNYLGDQMNENVTLEEIHKDVEDIKKQLHFISSLLVEKMNDEDIADYEEAVKEYKTGKATKLSDLKWQLHGVYPLHNKKAKEICRNSFSRLQENYERAYESFAG